MKKVSVLLLILLMLFIVGCSGGGSKKLSPYKNLPDFSKDFNVVFEHINSDYVNKEKINQIMGYLVSAYKSRDAESACEFVYEHNYSEDFSKIRGEISTKASSYLTSALENERNAAVKLTNEAFELSAANVTFGKWVMKYSHEKTLSKPNFKDVQTDLKTVINELSKVFYGKDIV